MKLGPLASQFVKSLEDRRLTLLTCALLIQLLGQVIYFWRNGSYIAKTLWINAGVSDQFAFAFDKFVCIGVIVCFLGSACTRYKVGYVMAGLWVFATSALECIFGGGFGADYAIFAHANRFGILIALGLMLCSHLNFERIVALTVSSVFAAHGLEAINQNPAFLDLLIRVGSHWFGLAIPEKIAGILLVVIGIQDILLAAALLILPNLRMVIAYMVFWGFITALSRFMFSTSYGLPQTMLRSMNFIGPMFLLLGTYSRQRPFELVWLAKGVILKIDSASKKILNQKQTSSS